MNEPTEPYASIDALLKAMGPRNQRLLLREIIAEATTNGPVPLKWILHYNARLLGREVRGE